MKSQLKIILFLVIATIIANEANAQFNNTDVLFYIDVEASLANPQTNVYIWKFRNGNLYKIMKIGTTLANVSENLKKDMYYYEKDEKQSFSSCWITKNSYNKIMSNIKWIVYSLSIEGLHSFTGAFGERVEGYPDYNCYGAFKKDLSEYTEWKEPDYDGAGRFIFRRISKSELRNLKFSMTRDFLQ